MDSFKILDASTQTLHQIDTITECRACPDNRYDRHRQYIYQQSGGNKGYRQYNFNQAHD